MKGEGILLKKSFDFAVRMVNIYKYLSAQKAEYVMSKQLLRSGTSIGANVRECSNVESKADFIHKLSIAQKECDETIYWLELLNATAFLSEQEKESVVGDAMQLLKMIKSSILTAKQNGKR